MIKGIQSTPHFGIQETSHFKNPQCFGNEHAFSSPFLKPKLLKCNKKVLLVHYIFIYFTFHLVVYTFLVFYVLYVIPLMISWEMIEDMKLAL